MAIALFKTPYGYSKMGFEDPEDKKHRKAQFLIYKAMEKADSMSPRRRQTSSIGLKLNKLRVKIGKRLLKKSKRMILMVSKARIVFYRQMIKQLKSLEALIWPCNDKAQGLSTQSYLA